MDGNKVQYVPFSVHVCFARFRVKVSSSSCFDKGRSNSIMEVIIYDYYLG
jgi:hypothetical protein